MLFSTQERPAGFRHGARRGGRSGLDRDTHQGGEEPKAGGERIETAERLPGWVDVTDGRLHITGLYQAWTAPERVRVPELTDHPLVWRRAVDVIRRDPPPYEPRFLHRGFHPGNVLFAGEGRGGDLRKSQSF